MTFDGNGVVVKDGSEKELMIKGVVFNEMKGVFADSQQLFDSVFFFLFIGLFFR